MKKKIVKIWGVGLTLAVLVSLVLAAAPASAASLGWSGVSTPNKGYGVLQAGTDVDFMAVAPDGTTMFAYDNTAKLLYKSTDSGGKWTSTNIGDTLETNAIVGLVVSPNYASDSTVVAASATKVYRSINSGKSFGEVGTAALAAKNVGVGNVALTSLDVSDHYLGGLAILVGAEDTDPADAGGVLRYTTSGLDWKDLEVGEVAFGTNIAGLGFDVLAVAFSPNHLGDAQYLAVIRDATDTYLTARFGNDAWAAGILNAKITGSLPASAVIAFADDYEWSSNNRVFVGTAGGAVAAGVTNTGKNDVYRMHGGLPGAGSKAYDLNVYGADTDTEVHSIAIKGSVAEAKVLVGQKGSPTVKYTTDPTASTVSWSGSSKSPTGAANVIVAWSPTVDDAYAATSGANSAFSVSRDGGAVFNQIALIDVSALADITIADVAAIDTSEIYAILADGGDKESLFKTTNGGSTWERIWCQDTLAIIAPSPNYATDSTIFVTEAGTRVWKTTTAGDKFIGLTAPAAITAIGVVDASTYYTGHADAFYKSGRWSSATLKGNTANSIVIGDDGTIYVGTTSGDVLKSTDDGKNFSGVGASDELGAGAVVLALDPGYASNKTIYAGSATVTEGVQRWVDDGSSVKWLQLTDDGGTLACSGVALSDDGTLYAASAAANKSVMRSVAPTGPNANVWDFERLDATDLPNADTGLMSLQVIPGSNVLYARANTDLDAGDDTTGTYGYEDRLLTFEDPLAVAPALSAPKDKSVTGTSVTLSWKELTSPLTIHYQYDVATDAKFANKIAAASGDTTGTSVTVTGLTAGQQYWWRVYADLGAGSPLTSKKSAYWTFTPKVAAPALKSPDYGDDDVLLRPTFSWMSVAGATSYELQVADNPFFARASVKKPLTHTTWTWDEDLEYNTQYYWRVQAVKSGKGILTNMSPWSEAVFTTAGPAAPPPPPPVQVTEYPPAAPQPAPIINLPQPQVNIPAAPAPVVPAPAIDPNAILAIIIIGAVLIIVVIVLIVRTRRVP